jgi:pimeloyl-[acyl-carrier protein] methyl ester esterase
MNDTSAIYSERIGHGPDLVMIHGWGLHGGAWGGLPAHLAGRFRVTVVDLPGHGRSPRAAPLSLDTLTAAVAEQIEGPAIWLGWSLGALVALDAALRFPGKVQKLVLTGATPRFTRAPDWPQAISPEILAEFAAELHGDYQATLLRFLSLQVGGADEAHATLRALRAEVLRHGAPDGEALREGLAILSQTDLRARLGEIRAPTRIIHGGRDRLSPPAAARALAAHLPHAQLDMIAAAGHAPFLSHAREFSTCLDEFLHD